MINKEDLRKVLSVMEDIYSHESTRKKYYCHDCKKLLEIDSSMIMSKIKGHENCRSLQYKNGYYDCIELGYNVIADLRVSKDDLIDVIMATLEGNK